MKYKMYKLSKKLYKLNCSEYVSSKEVLKDFKKSIDNNTMHEFEIMEVHKEKSNYLNAKKDITLKFLSEQIFKELKGKTLTRSALIDICKSGGITKILKDKLGDDIEYDGFIPSSKRFQKIDSGLNDE